MKTRRAGSSERPRAQAALVSLTTRRSRHADPDAVLEELNGLARAAGADVRLTVTQERASADSATLIGKGKAEWLARACDEASVDLIIVDNELSAAQARNLAEVCKVRVIDRTELILDIFAQRARTREGQLQVELAQLRYLLPRLTGAGAEMSRLGGGIGTRGPGETKLETDRRRIRARISVLKQDIDEVQRRRRYLRAKRRSSDVPVVALVGYTNAGKTTLFNWLTGSDAIASDALFVTLDPLMRRVKVGDARQILIADTVGFIDRLPHQLVAAFHGTLEEVAGADLLLHVIDAAAPDWRRRVDAVRAVLGEIEAEHVPIVEVFNKIDLLPREELEGLVAAHPEALMTSGVKATGRDELLERVADRLEMDTTRVSFEFDEKKEADRRLVAELYRHARVVSHVTEEGRISIDADVPRRLVSRFTRVKVPA